MQKILRLLKNRFVVIAIDTLMVPLAWYGSYWLRFNLNTIPQVIFLEATRSLPIVLILQLFSFWIFGLYRGIWEFASIPDFIRIIKSVLIAGLVSAISFFFLSIHTPRSTLLIYIWLLVSLLSCSRVLAKWSKGYHATKTTGKRVLIVGAGAAAEMLLKEIVKNREQNNYIPIALVDDDLSKQGCEIFCVRVVGTIKDIPRITTKYRIEKVIIAIPSAKPQIINDIVNLCNQVKVPFSSIPIIGDIVSKKVSINTLREVALEDLLGRDPVNLDWQQISQQISGKKILVSGGGGSIGSELCRQIAMLGPAVLMIVDNNEFNLYSIDKELNDKFPHLKILSLLIDITDETAIQKIIQYYQPNILFHAAAYKHVPLLENQARVAIRNNVLGTHNVVKYAVEYNVNAFILISTDKAVYPANVMGATKRAAEIICQTYSKHQNFTKFITVRFGNVLGSTGSVIPLFKSQLAKGLNLTVTHPEISRYFMTIPEATQLILQAKAIGNGGEIFVLDMGKPITIKTLAEKMITLSGKDVDIVYTGLRPGEKLHEELFYSTEELALTKHHKIFQAKPQQDCSLEWLLPIIQKIYDTCTQSLNNIAAKKLLKELVKEYCYISEAEEQ